MSQEQPQRPVTYKDVFGDSVQGEIASQPVTVEDAALMQSAEALGFGKTAKGGAASLMQAAADKNVREQGVDPDSHTNVPESGFSLRELEVDGKVFRQELVGQQPVTEETAFVPTLAGIAGTQGVTIGEALEEAASNNPDQVVDKDIARTIQSAEARATGMPISLKGGVAAAVQSAADKNATQDQKITLSEVLDEATSQMLVDKVATQEDVEKVKRGAAGGESTVIVSALQEAVDANASAERYIKMQEEEAESLPSSPSQELLLPNDQPLSAEVGLDREKHPHAD